MTRSGRSRLPGLNGDIAFIKQGPAGQESGQNEPNIYVVKIDQGKVDDAACRDDLIDSPSIRHRPIETGPATIDTTANDAGRKRNAWISSSSMS